MALTQSLCDQLAAGVFVFLNEVLNLILYVPSVVANYKVPRAQLVWLSVAAIGHQHRVEVFQEFGVVARRLEHKLLIEKFEDGRRFLALDQVDGRLVVLELDVLPADSFVRILLLLHLKHLLVEDGLEFLVCVVYAQLLERIMLKVLEPKNVEQPDKQQLLRRLAFPHNGVVYFAHDPVEQLSVQMLCYRVPCEVRLLKGQS